LRSSSATSFSSRICCAATTTASVPRPFPCAVPASSASR
jgi:hypothetical protein